MKKLLAFLGASCALAAACLNAGAEVSLSGKGKSQNFGTIQEALDAIGPEAGSYTIKLPVIYAVR